MPKRNMKASDRVRTGTARAVAMSGSALAKVSGRQMKTSPATTTSAVPANTERWVESTETICPVNSPNLLAERPSYSDKNKMPRPSPKGMMTPITEFLSRARTPMTPNSSAAKMEPTSEPIMTSAPTSSANAAPAKDSSAMPCTAKARSRIMTNVPISPPTTPRIAPASRVSVNSGSNSP